MGRFIGQPIQFEDYGDNKHIRVISKITYEADDGTSWSAGGGKGFVTDGASIPGIFWSVIGQPLSPQTIEAAVIHDRYCKIRTRPHQLVHKTFCAMLKDLRVPWWKRSAMCVAVKLFGPRWKL